MTLSRQIREADRKLTALENDVKAVRLIQRMNRDEQEKLAMKLLLLKAQMILSRHGEFQAADEIGDFLSTPFADSGELALTADKTSGPAPVGLAGNGAVCGARPRIVLCNPERKSIVRSAEERGK